MSIHVMMSDGKKDQWGSKYMKSVYKDRAAFRQAIATLDNIIETMSRHYKERFVSLPGDVTSLWDDYWHLERLVAGIETCGEDWRETVERLTTARNNLQILVDAAEFYKAHNWGEKSDAKKADDVLKKIFTLGASGSFDSEVDVHYNC